jgi:hypothetical protein
MPVQINEVIVKTVVSGGTTGTGAAAATSASSSHTSEAELAAMVLEIIKEKKER